LSTWTQARLHLAPTYFGVQPADPRARPAARAGLAGRPVQGRSRVRPGL